MEQINQPHDFSNTVIAILETTPQARAAVDSLTAAGLDAEVLSGEPGRSHLDAEAESGLVAKLRLLARGLGDETRILHHLDIALAEGRTVISVDVESDQTPVAATILEQHDGRYIWRFGEWSFNRIGAGDEDEDSVADESDAPPVPTAKPDQDSGRRISSTRRPEN